MKFGPSLRDDAYFKLQFWPDKHGRGGRQLNGLLLSEEPVPNAEALGALSVAVQGFPALERLLFDEDEAAFVGEGGARRCALALSVSRNLSGLTATLARDWVFYDPVDEREFVTRAYRSYLEMFSVIAELKLKRPMGKSLKAARPKRVGGVAQRPVVCGNWRRTSKRCAWCSKVKADGSDSGLCSTTVIRKHASLPTA